MRLGSPCRPITPSWSEPTLGFLVHDVARLLRKRLEQRARAAGIGLSRAQWQVLANIARCEGINQAGLAGILEIEPITLVRLLDRLEGMGLSSGGWTRAIAGSATCSSPRRRGRSWSASACSGPQVREEALAGLDEPSRQRLLAELAASRPTCRRSCHR